MALKRIWQGLRPRSLNARLLLLMSLVTLLTVVALGAHTIHTESDEALDMLRHQASAMARTVAMSSVNPLLTDQLDQVEASLLREASFPGVLSLHVLDAQGEIVSQVQANGGKPKLVFAAPGSRLRPPALAQAGVDTPAGAGSLVAWYPVAAGRQLGWARVEQSLAPLDVLRGRVWVRTLSAGALALLCSSLLLQWLLRLPMRALGQARHFAVGLARADGQQLAFPADGAEEMVQLGQALNLASAQLLTQRQTIDASIVELWAQRAELQDINLQLGAIFALSPDGLVSFDAEGRVRFANPAFSHLTGLDPGTLIDQSQAALETRLGALCEDAAAWTGLDRYFEEPPGDAPAAAANADAAPQTLALRHPRPSVLSLRGRRADAAGTGAVSRVLHLRDITRETEVDRLKSEFLSTAAHELRTPIASIHGFAELLGQRSFTPERTQQMLQKIHRNSGTMIRILNGLLDLSRLEARGDDDFVRARSDLATLVARHLVDLAPPDGRAAPALQSLPMALPADVDAGKIGQVLGNLLGNAYKYSPAGGAVQVRLLHEALAGRPARVGFAVVDCGIGMSTEQAARMFERFYRADPSGTILGTGLGLSIVKEIVTLHGGSLEVYSQPGKGTTVEVWLPMAGGATEVAPVRPMSTAVDALQQA